METDDGASARSGPDRMAALQAALGSGDLRAAHGLALGALADGAADRGAVHSLLGSLSEALGQDADARAHFEQALSLGAASPEDRARLGALVKVSDPPRATRLLEGALAAGFDASWAHGLMGDIHQNDADYSRACTAFQAALARESSPEDRPALLARLVESAARSDALEIACTTAETLAAFPTEIPTAPTVSALWALLPFATRTEALINQILARPEFADRDPNAQSRVAQLRARAAIWAKAPERALNLAKTAVALTPDDPIASVLLGETLILNEDLDAAEARLLPEIDRGRCVLMTALALATSLRTAGFAGRALAVLQRAAGTWPDNPGVLLEIARTQVDLGRDDEGRAAMERASALDPEIAAQGQRVHTAFLATLRAAPGILAQVVPSKLQGALIDLDRVRYGHNAMVMAIRMRDTRLFLKAFLPGRRTLAHLRTTALLMNGLPQMAGIETPNILTSEGAEAVFSTGLGPAFVMTAVPGASLRRSLADPRATMTPTHAEALGSALARIHAALAQCRTWSRGDQAPVGMASGLDGFARLHAGTFTPEALPMAFGFAGALATAYPQLFAPIAAHLKRLTPIVGPAIASLVRQPIHGDFGWHNVTWGGVDGAQVLGVIDFDYASVDLPLSDLLNAIHRTAFDWKRLMTHGDPRPRPALAKALVDGYRAAGGELPFEGAVLDACFAAVRVRYYLSMAGAGAREDGHQDGGAARGYNHAEDTLTMLNEQLDWLARSGGLSALLNG